MLYKIYHAPYEKHFSTVKPVFKRLLSETAIHSFMKTNFAYFFFYVLLLLVKTMSYTLHTRVEFHLKSKSSFCLRFQQKSIIQNDWEENGVKRGKMAMYFWVEFVYTFAKIFQNFHFFFTVLKSQKSQQVIMPRTKFFFWFWYQYFRLM